MIYNIKKMLRNYSHKNKFVKKLYRIGNTIKVKSLANISDERFAKMKYKENTGKKLNLENPLTFNEKLWWLKLNNRDPLLTICSDKVKVREYVRNCGLGHILNEVYGVYDDASDINFYKLPDKAFIRTNHCSGTNAIWDKSNPFNREKFIKRFNYSLKQNYFLQSREWNYKNIEPKIIVEKILEDKDNPTLIDYKILCFEGIAKLVFVELGIVLPDGTQNPYSTRNIYDNQFNLLDVKIRSENFDKSLVSKPDNFEDMIKYAEILAKPFPHCRVDLYNISGEIYFGEMTFYNGGATEKITPEKWNKKIGDWIDLESEKITLVK